MKVVQGFVNIASLIKNQPGTNSPIGELSTFSKTYSKEKGLYQSYSHPGYQLITFSSFNQNTGNLLELDQQFVDEILEVVRETFQYTSTRTRPYNFQDMVRTLQQEFKLKISNLTLGELVDGDQVALPSFLRWNSIIQNNSEVTIWLSDAHFADQYTGYEITVIPPLNILDDFFLPFSSVVSSLEQVSMARLGERIQEAKLRQPETVVRLMEFNFQNRHDPSLKRKTTWGILVYGKEGDYEDAIKDAIVDWLVQNSDFGSEQWQSIFPEIFERTEMVVIPRWDQIATQNLVDRSSLYSSLLNLGEAYQFVQDFINFYDLQHVRSNTYIMPYTFKTIMVTITNGIKNSLGKEDFKRMYSDYLPVPSVSFDFARMQLKTAEFCLFLDDVLLSAETATPTTPLVSGTRRVVRNGIFFISAMHDGINYLVAAKHNPIFIKQ